MPVKNAGTPEIGGTVGNVYTPEHAAEVTANLVAEESSLAALVSRNYADDLLGGGKAGAPILIKQPTTLVARSREIDDVETSIVMDKINEKGLTLNLDRRMVYSAVALDEADLNLNLTDFSSQVLAPQASAVVDDLEARVLETLRTVDSGADFAAGSYDPSKPVRFVTLLRKALRDNGVPVAGLNVLVGTQVYADLLDADLITDASASGTTAALREAAVGKVRGLTVVERADLDENELIAFHRDAVTLATRAPAVPTGAAFGQTISERGFSLRYLRDYLAEKTVNRSFVATFAAVGLLPTYKVTRTRAANPADNAPLGSVSIDEIPNGGVVRIPDLTALVAAPGTEA